MEHTGEIREPYEEEWSEVTPWPAGSSAIMPPSTGRVQLWALVLDARSVPCRLERSGGGLCLSVPASQLERAREELRLFEEKNRDWPPAAPPAHPLAENTLATLSILVLLATFHNLTQFEGMLLTFSQPDWVALGTAQAAEIRGGQWWRLVTALTLHADSLHLMSNLAIGGIFVLFLCRELGSGLAWSLLLGAGILGNLANAYVQAPGHSSVGASTAVFGAVGILAALSLVRYRQQLQRRWPLPVASALALLALLGTEGKNTDLGAHLFGFLFGTCLGLLTEYLLGRYGRPGRLMNVLLALLSAVVVIAAWWAALVFGE
ncbi:rhomboid family intramembrane serine protease [Oryzomonas japonica]|uniref:Rhomboid family intramembrane serine protease n=1 Tax=Oryzomonas japonica TaxID=2603858 RepID=A0A7J4ZUT2_9BACT|nr:rhomboid family intramembrane serine protease [Oryzomonas japonica]KAB0667396.1 rhomboid family intramembrane serine protease [Oryzomonas japonica]